MDLTALESRERSAPAHTALVTSITAERLALFSIQSVREFSFPYASCYDSSNATYTRALVGSGYWCNIGLAGLFGYDLGCNEPRGPLCQALHDSPPWTVLAALVAAPSVWTTWYLRTAHKLDDIYLARAQHSTTQYLEAVKLMQAKEPAANIAAIYVLERLVRESVTDAMTVAQLLAAFVRTNAQQPDPRENNYDDDIEEPSQPVQAALDTLGRLPVPSAFVIDLRDTDLCRARLTGNATGRMILNNSWLTEAFLLGNFEGANFARTSLRGATLGGNFRKAVFRAVSRKLSPKSLDQFKYVDSQLTGLSVTAPIGVQLRVLPVQRLGARA